jgi:alpha-tubulin suppressor-like RCC1 family protein
MFKLIYPSADGSCYMFGESADGQLGLGVSNETVSKLTRVPLIDKIISVHCSNKITMLLTGMSLNA